MMYSGLYTALLTPFDSDGRIDHKGLVELVKRQMKARVQGLVVAGTTGEGITLTFDEKREAVKTVRQAYSSGYLMVGCGLSSTAQTQQMIEMASEEGADLALVITPFYNKPNQDGLLRHFSTLAASSPIPIVLYNNPGRAAVDFSIETLLRLIEFPNIVGIKETSGKLIQVTECIEILKKYRPDFAVFSGDDLLTLPILAAGGNGVISGGANLIPDQIRRLVEKCLEGNFKQAREEFAPFIPLLQAFLLDSNPIPVKAAMKLCGLPSGDPRLPLTPLSQEKELLILQALETSGILARV